jgi:hypothetical protein
MDKKKRGKKGLCKWEGQANLMSQFVQTKLDNEYKGFWQR